MRVYISFGDGSAVSYDGKTFTLHKQPIGIDADLSAFFAASGGMAVRSWRERRKELVSALENAWWREFTRLKKTSMKKIYSKPALITEEKIKEKIGEKIEEKIERK